MYTHIHTSTRARIASVQKSGLRLIVFQEIGNQSDVSSTSLVLKSFLRKNSIHTRTQMKSSDVQGTEYKTVYNLTSQYSAIVSTNEAVTTFQTEVNREWMMGSS
ncbi:hypothetical protein L798_09618 [Zootermopsis nevadensis]|uniref:Uncharacterized protein n=1 Tax=Zootermopsis nevadensis TaxID=136037 RepID=A0A067R2H6_ZOONE|nr:hypothetical protein L798_09618 [Zootermopsis nevadensis]